MKTTEQKAQAFINRCQAVVTSEGNLYSEAAVYSAYIAGANEALAGQWRSVDDELPKAEQDVLVAIDTQTNHQFAFAWLSTLSNGTMRWYSHDDTFPLDKIRYWMPLPPIHMKLYKPTNP